MSSVTPKTDSDQIRICAADACPLQAAKSDRRWPGWARLGFFVIAGVAAWSLVIWLVSLV